MPQIITYTFNNQQLRAVYLDINKILFCLTDVCRIANLTNPSSVSAMVKEEFGVENLPTWEFPTNTGSQHFNMVTLEQLIFTIMRFKAKSVKAFRHWVFIELFPLLLKQRVLANKEVIDLKLQKELKFLKACLDTGNITKEEQMTMLENIRKVYIHAN